MEKNDTEWKMMMNLNNCKRLVVKTTWFQDISKLDEELQDVAW